MEGRRTLSPGGNNYPLGLVLETPKLRGKPYSHAHLGRHEALRGEAVCSGFHSQLLVGLGFQSSSPDPEPSPDPPTPPAFTKRLPDAAVQQMLGALVKNPAFGASLSL